MLTRSTIGFDALRRRLRRSGALWLICAGFVIATFVAAALAVITLGRAAQEANRREIRAVGTAVAAQTSRYIQVIDLGLDRLQERVDHMQGATPADFDRVMSNRTTFDLLHQVARYLPQTDTLVIVNRSGQLINFTRAYPPPQIDASDRDFFRYLRHHRGHALFFSKPLTTRYRNIPAVLVARRLNAPDGSFLGVAAAVLSARELQRFYASVIGVTGQRTKLLRRDGTVLVTWPQLAHPFTLVPTTSRWHAVVAAGGGTFHASGRFISVHPLAGYPLVINASLADRQALAGWRRQAMMIGVAALVVAVAVVLLFGIIVRQVRNLEARNLELARTAAELGSSEARMLAFARTASDWFWELDADLCFRPVGIEPNGIVAGLPTPAGTRLWDVFDADPETEERERHRSSIAARQPFRDFYFRRTDAEGQVRHLSASGIPLFDEAGAFAGYRGTTRDIKAQMAATAELRAAKGRAERAEALLEDAVNAISEGFVIFDRDDRFVMCNEVVRTMYPERRDYLVPGYEYEEMLRDGLARGDYPEAAGREEEWLAALLRDHRAAAGTRERQTADGRTILITERRMRDGGIAGLRIDITELKQAQEALRASEARLDRAQEIAGIGSWELDIATGRFTWSKQMYRLRGLEEGVFEPTLAGVAPYTDDPDLIRHWLTGLAQKGTPGALEYGITLPDGRTRLVHNEGRAIVDADGVVRRVAGTMQDITDQRLLQRQLAQAQKMEAIGNLTGGIAHDFNNAIGVIVGNMQLLLEQIAGTADARELCEDALAAGRRAADLTQRLLAFARRQPLSPRSIDINHMIGETVKLLRRVVQPNIDTVFDPAPELHSIVIDPVQLEAAITNLSVNAADAMPMGGRLRIATGVAMLDSGYAALHPEVVPGRYTLITVSDTGSGMSPEVMEHIFEPFFTTKPPGQGTGLGLSMVFGFIKQSGGHITVYSEPGHGTTFRLYLPTRAGSAPEPHAPSTESIPGGGQTVLLVEDDALLRRTVLRQLMELGYKVIEADSAMAAIAVLESGAPIGLVLSDVVMPGEIDGVGLAERVSRAFPSIRILLISGFPEARSNGHAGVAPRFRLLGKPFDRDQLAAAIWAVLGPWPAAGAPPLEGTGIL